MPVSKSEPVAIIGAGVFGLATALQLAQDGYTDVSVFEKDDQVPPRHSAAFDINKIVRPEYQDPWYTELTIKAIEAWKSPLYAPYYHETGFLHLVSGTAPQQAADTRDSFVKTIRHHPRFESILKNINSPEDIKQVAWQLDGEFPGWNGYFNPLAGYAHSADALRGVYKAAAARGVKFFLGDQGDVAQLVYDQNHQATGVMTRSGRYHPAKVTVVAAGAAAATLVPEVGQQVVAKSWSLGHVRLTDEETSMLRGIPVTYARDLGFYFEPDPKTNLLKICPMGGGYINTDPKTGVSLPPSLADSDDVLPPDDERRMRRLLRESLPALADRPFVEKKLCWFADTADSDFIIDYVPNTGSSVVVCSGDSGHLFKMFPIAGQWVHQLLQGDGQSEARWRWKQKSDSKWAGGDVSWRLGQTKEFAEIKVPKAKL
ncbi:sarcosine oxidase [Aspergillus avenaceus]|uniref:Sarcosine oxidase n=1 Tax=Aspergillus avenaceus TaxID=36643 RepID=A0A5N6TSP5_ASPAV|nr:sarcosine oxidase [Aspergillus avenaceus]